MRTTLLGLALLLILSRDAASDPPPASGTTTTPQGVGVPQARKPTEDGRQAAGEAAAEGVDREKADLRVKIEDVNARLSAISRRQAEVESEYKLQAATLEAERLKVDASRRALLQRYNDLNRQSRVIPQPKLGEAKSDRTRGDRGPLEQTKAGASVDQKLDAILTKLEQMEGRLRKLEGASKKE